MNKYLIGLALFVSGLAHGVLGTLALAPVPTPIQVECPCKCGKPEVSPKPVKPAGDLPPQGFGASPPLGAVEPRCNCHPCTCGKTCRCDWIAAVRRRLGGGPHDGPIMSPDPLTGELRAIGWNSWGDYSALAK